MATGSPTRLTVANFTTRNTLAADSNYGARHVQIASLGTVLWGDYPGNATGGYLGGSSAAAAVGVGRRSAPLRCRPVRNCGPGPSGDHRRRKQRRPGVAREGRGERPAVRHGSARGARAPGYDTALGVQSRRSGLRVPVARRRARRGSRGSRRATRSSRGTPSPLTGARRSCPRAQPTSAPRSVRGTTAGGCPRTTYRATERSRPRPPAVVSAELRGPRAATRARRARTASPRAGGGSASPGAGTTAPAPRPGGALARRCGRAAA